MHTPSNVNTGPRVLEKAKRWSTNPQSVRVEPFYPRPLTQPAFWKLNGPRCPFPSCPRVWRQQHMDLSSHPPPLLLSETELRLPIAEALLVSLAYLCLCDKSLALFRARCLKLPPSLTSQSSDYGSVQSPSTDCGAPQPNRSAGSKRPISLQWHPTGLLPSVNVCGEFSLKHSYGSTAWGASGILPSGYISSRKDRSCSLCKYLQA